MNDPIVRQGPRALPKPACLGSLGARRGSPAGSVCVRARKDTAAPSNLQGPVGPTAKRHPGRQAWDINRLIRGSAVGAALAIPTSFRHNRHGNSLFDKINAKKSTIPPIWKALGERWARCPVHALLSTRRPARSGLRCGKRPRSEARLRRMVVFQSADPLGGKPNGVESLHG
jgi:hypothetical protein